MNDTPEYRIAALSLRPGDTLVAKVEGVLTTEMLQTVGDIIRRHVAPDVPLLVLDKRVDLQVVSTAYSQALIDVIAERRRQIEVEGWTPEHDDEHDHGELAAAGSCYALAGAVILNPYTQGDGIEAGPMPPYAWPFEPEAWKIDRHDPRRALVKAAALILAEIESLDRNPMPESGQ